MAQKILAVLFDFDGTLVDSEQYYMLCGVQSMVEAGIDREAATQFYREKISGVRSDLKPALFAQAFPQLDYQAYDARYQSRCDQWRLEKPIVAKPGANELLHNLKARGYKLALVTMSTYEEVQQVCQQTGLDFSVFDCYCGGSGCAAKPDPGVYLAAMQALGVTPEQTMVVEDSNVGALAAINAGATTVVVKDQSVLSDEVLAKADQIFEMNQIAKVQTLLK